MSTAEVDAYIAALDEPRHSTLEELRRRILEVVPDAEQGLSYGAPVFKVEGKRLAGFAAYKAHLAYLPHSGTTTETLKDELSGYAVSKGAFKFPVDAAPPQDLVRLLIQTRMAEESIEGGGHVPG